MWVLCKQEAFCFGWFIFTFSFLANAFFPSFSWLVFISISRRVKAWGCRLQGRVASAAKTMGWGCGQAVEGNIWNQEMFYCLQSKTHNGVTPQALRISAQFANTPFLVLFSQQSEKATQHSSSHTGCLPLPEHPFLLGPGRQQCYAKGSWHASIW